MTNNNDIVELLDILYGMVNEAWSVPLGNDKCIIEREKAIEIINDIKANLPSSIAESKRLVAAREEFVGNAKREAEALRKNAQEESERLINDQEVLKAAKMRAAQLLQEANKKNEELRNAATTYVTNLLGDAEKSLSVSLETLRATQAAFKSGGTSASETKNTEVAQSEISADSTPAAVPDVKKPDSNTAEKTAQEKPAKKRPQIIDVDNDANWIEK